jgi:outer membrane beta-barrel protein
MKKIFLLSFSLFLFLCTSLTVHAAETIEFPEEELAKESVLPVFENSRSVLNRNVLTQGRLELGLGGGLSLNDAFYNPMIYGITGSYHFTEEHALNLTATFWSEGLSTYGEQLERGEGLTGKNFDAGYAPHAKSMFLANYQFTAFYGKISLSKKAVMNLTLHGLAGLGMIQMDGISPIVANVGFGQRFFFTPRIALRMDLSLLMYQGPDPTSVDLNDKAPAAPPSPSASDFQKELQFQTLLQGYLVFLL